MTNKLEKNLELRKALAEVDRLTSENVSLDYINSEQDTIIKDLKNQLDIVWDHMETSDKEIFGLRDKYRDLKLRITNQMYLFETGENSPYKMVEIIKEILK